MGTWVIALVIGAVYGVAGTIGQAAVWGPVPLGLVIAVIGVLLAPAGRGGVAPIASGGALRACTTGWR